jgi:hypothetical protein
MNGTNPTRRRNSATPKTLLSRRHRAVRSVDQIGRAKQAFAKGFLDLAYFLAIRHSDVVRGPRIEALPRLDAHQFHRLRVVRIEADVLFELEPRLLNEAEGLVLIREGELVLIDH